MCCTVQLVPDSGHFFEAKERKVLPKSEFNPPSVSNLVNVKATSSFLKTRELWPHKHTPYCCFKIDLKNRNGLWTKIAF